MMPTTKLPWVCKGPVTMWSPKASREVEEKGLAVPGAAAADTAGPSAGQRAHLGPGQAKAGTKGGLSPPTLISSRLRVAREAQLNHCSPDPAEHCIIPRAAVGLHHAATPRTVPQSQPQLCSGLAAGCSGLCWPRGQVWDPGMGL